MSFQVFNRNIENKNTIQVPTSSEKNLIPIINEKEFQLRQSDFSNGTVRIQVPGIYRLVEDIKFNPNPGIYDPSTKTFSGLKWMPSQDQIDSGKYPIAPMGPYHMGFFTAITIECENVVIDLGGYTLSQSYEHHLQQRFFALITLGSSPFITGQGPANFGRFKLCNNVIIRNGTLGLSSHQSIQGNEARNILIENIDCVDFEQAGIALNGSHYVTIRNVNIERNSRNVGVQATYSHGRFLLPILEKLISEGDPSISILGVDKSGSEILEELNFDLNSSFEDIIIHKRKPQNTIFASDQHSSCDGAVYGIVLNTRGVAIGPFIQSCAWTNNKDIILENISISNLKSNPIEYEGLSSYGISSSMYGGNVMKGPVGDVIRFSNIIDDNERYTPNSLSNAQFYFNKHASLIGRASSVPTNVLTDFVELGNILPSVMASHQLFFKYGGDAMAHVMKGNIGIFLSGAKDVKVRNVIVKEISNLGLDSNGTDPYRGCDCSGIVVNCCNKIDFTKVGIHDIFSYFGNSNGIEVMRSVDINTDDCDISKICIENIFNSFSLNKLASQIQKFE